VTSGEQTTQRPPVTVQALTGVLAAAAAIGVAEVLAGFIRAVASPVIAVGGVAIDAAPVWLKDFAIRTFGTHDKAVLLAGIGVVLLLYSAAVGVLAYRSLRAGVVGVAVFAGLGAAAALTRPDAGLADTLPSIVGGVVGVAALVRLVRAAQPADARPADAQPADAQPADAQPDEIPPTDPEPAEVPLPGRWNRRAFLASGIGVGALAVATGGLSRLVTRGADVEASRSAVALPAPASPATRLPAGADLRLPGLTPFTTANKDFYRVDTALIVPKVSTQDWGLRIHGMVDRELRLDYPSLLARPMIERDVTLTCVSNEVGGSYAGSARWLGAALRDLLAEAGVRPGATQLVGRSADGFTAGTPVSVVMDGRDALLAVGMNGQPLPLEHGFPVRMVVPGLYGYVSATKWLVDLELTTFEAFDPYWIRRGWAAEGPIKTMARIDTPKPLAATRRGTIPVAGVAWAQHRGIEKVEVRVDDGDWHATRLAAAPTKDTWRQWVWEWPATAGKHTLQARATDGNGDLQTDRRADPFPDGATGWHTVVVSVT
jgi:DMSO/TMAO reductase YedYZ molybdopterin-dependent catalytic subunit